MGLQTTCIRCDNGPHFTAAVIAAFFKTTKAKLHFVTPYQHQSNGIVERVNYEVMRHLRSIVYDRDVKKTWSMFIPLVQRVLNTTVHSATHYTPSQLLFASMVDPDRGVLTTMSKVIPHGFTHDEYFGTLCKAQEAILSAARTFQSATDAARKLKSPTESVKYVVGDLVLCNRTDSFSSKLSMTQGPYIIRAEVKPDVYTIEHPANGKIIKEVHASKLTPFTYNRSAYPDSNSQENLAEKVARPDDDDVYLVDAIIDHCYATRTKDKDLIIKPASFSSKPRDIRRRASFFRVRWVGYDDPRFDTWERFSTLEDNSVLHDWLTQHPELDLLD
jgi:hypothetical protein